MKTILTAILALLVPSFALAAGPKGPTMVGPGLAANRAFVRELGNRTIDMRDVAPSTRTFRLSPSDAPDANAGPFSTPPAFQRFAGLSGGSGFPDVALAASKKWILQGAGHGFSVLDTSGNVQSGWPKSATSFFQIPAPGPCAPDGPIVFNPRTFYDPNDDRFWASISTIETMPCPQTETIWVAVSQTNDPRGAWNIYAFNADPLQTGGVLETNELGFDNQAVYFGGNLFNPDTDSGYSEIFFASKSLMESGKLVGAGEFYDFQGPSGAFDSVQPVNTETNNGAPGVEYLINTDDINGEGCLSACTDITVWAIVNPLTAPSLSGFTLQTFESYTAPPDIDEPDCSPCLGTESVQISSTPVFTASRGRGVVAFAFVTGAQNSTQNVAAVLWGEVHPRLNRAAKIISLNEYQAGYIIGDGDLANFFPATMASNDGSLWVLANQSSSSVFPRIIYRVQRPSDPLGHLESALKLKRGVGPPVTGSSQLGNYNAMSVDGLVAGQSSVWMAGQYFDTGGVWATYIGHDN